MALDLGNLLQKYLNVPAGQSPPDVANHFDEVAQQASPQVMSQGIADALRSDQTPPLGQMVSEMFSRANPNQPYIVYNDLPKLEALKKQFPAWYR